MSLYNLIEYSDNYLKTSGSLWEYYRDETADPITCSTSFRYDTGSLNNTNIDGTINAETVV